MSTSSSITNKRPAAAEQAESTSSSSQPEKKSKSSSSLSFGQRVVEVKTNDSEQVYYELASSLTRNAFASLTVGKAASLALRGKKAEMETEGTALYASWRQSRDGDRDPKKAFPWGFSPQAPLQRAWADLSGTSKDVATETFLAKFDAFMNSDEALAEEMCLSDGQYQLEALLEEAKKKAAENSK